MDGTISQKVPGTGRHAMIPSIFKRSLMALITYGINHKTADLALREHMVFDSSTLPEALQDLKNQCAVNEAVLLSTCNRTEIYADSTNPQALAHWLAKDRKLDARTLEACSYTHHNAAAIRHMMRVASGLDSMVLGEPQILGQMKQAYSVAQNAGVVGPQFQTLFPAIFATCKQVRTQTQIGAHPISMAYAIVQLAKHIFSNLKECTVLCVGAGETIELAATHLFNCGIKRLIIANRSLKKAEVLAKRHQAQLIPLTEIPAYLKEADLVITATGSELPILGKGMVESALKQRRHKPIMMADLAVPRDIEAEVGTLEDVYLYNIDDLQRVSSQNLSARSSAAEHAELLINVQANHYIQQLRLLDASDMIQQYRSRVETLRDQELTKALKQLQSAENPQTVLAALAHNLSNKLMHQPTLTLREAAYEGNLELLNFSKQCLDIEL